MSKMKRAKIVKFRLDELAGVDAGAQAAAGTVCVKRKVDADKTPATSTTKRAALTTAVAGHVHMLHSIDDMQSGCTSGEPLYTTGDSYGYSGYHSHSWVRTEDGSIIIGESAGHTHEVSTLAGSLVAKAADKSSPSIEVGKVTPMSTKFVVLTESQHALFQTLAESDRESFLTKSSGDRDADVAKAAAADPIVFTGEITKAVVRKSHGELALKFAQQSEQQAVELAKAKADIAKANEARDLVELTKRATDTIGSLAGDTATHIALMRAAESISDETLRTAAVTTLKAANAAMKAAAKPSGFGGSENLTAVDGLTVFNAEVAKFATKHDIKDSGLALERFLGTEDGKVAKAAYDKTRAYGGI